MATGLKKHFPDIRFSGNLVTPDEIDRYETYHAAIMTGAMVLGTAVGTSTQAKTVTFDQVIPDCPRSIDMVISCASGSTKGGTATVTGYDQFGVAQSETFAATAAANGGTIQGTKVWAKITTGPTFTFATCNAGNGTVQFKVGTAGSVALFGLPFKLGAVADVKVYNFGTNSVAVNVGGGTYTSFVSTAAHAIVAPVDVANIAWANVWAAPSYNAEYDGSARMTNL